MGILEDLNKLYNKWDSEGGHSGSDNYEDALYKCINELADVIIKYENQPGGTLEVDPADGKKQPPTVSEVECLRLNKKAPADRGRT